MILAIVAPIEIGKAIDAGLCQAVCVPTENDPSWLYEGWRTTDNDTVNPPMYLEFYIYNVSNYAEMIIDGAEAEITHFGPYTYKLRYEKYNIEYSDDNSEVGYEINTEYTFMPDMSYGPESDEYWNVDLPFLSGAQLFYATKGEPLETTQLILCDVGGETSKLQACLFGKRNVTEYVFSQWSSTIALSNHLYFNLRPVDPHFNLFPRCYGNEDCHTKQTQMTNFGLGGYCNLTFPNNHTNVNNRTNSTMFIPYQFCKDPANTPGTDIRTWEYTGHGTFDDVGKYILWRGNDSNWFWNNTQPDGTIKLEYAAGAYGQYQFKPDLKDDDELTTWDDFAFRRVPLQYVNEHEEYGVTLWRFRTADSLFNGTDPYYYEDDIPGYLNATIISLLQFGSFSPTLASQAFNAGVPPEMRNYNCTNCPEDIDELNPDDLNNLYGSWLDVSPRLGKVLSGAKRLQLNSIIGDPALFGNSSCITRKCPFNKIPYTYLPYVIYNFTASFNDTQAKLVRDGLDSIDLGHTMQKVTISLGVIFCVFFLFLAGWLWQRSKALAESESTDAYTAIRQPVN